MLINKRPFPVGLGFFNLEHGMYKYTEHEAGPGDRRLPS